MSLILAQGAAHVKPHQLKQVVDKIVDEQFDGIQQFISGKVNQRMRDEYGIPMINDYHQLSYVVEEKYDGFSYLNDGGRFFSKRLSEAKGSEGIPIDKTGHLPHLSHIMKTAFELGGIDVHGEIYVPGGISDDVTKILGCNEDEAKRRIYLGWDKRPRFMLIDIRKFRGLSVINCPYHIRRSLLEYAYETYIKPYDTFGDVMLAELLWGDPREHFQRIVRNGGEGIIMKKTDALYIPDKKPAGNWIKGKKKVLADVVVTGFNDGTGKNKSLFGSFEFGLYVNGKLTKCGSCSSGLNDETRQTVAANPEKYIGMVMEIEAIQESVKSFRNAVFKRLRDDKSAEECTPDIVKVIDTLI